VGALTAVPLEYATIQYSDFSKGDPRSLFDLIGAINQLPAGQTNNPAAVRPAAPIAPLDEIAAILDTQSNLELKDQSTILYRLKDALKDPQSKPRVLELVGVLLNKTQYVPIQTECRALLEANRPSAAIPAPTTPRIRQGWLVIGAVIILLLGIGSVAFAIAQANTNSALSASNTQIAIQSTNQALLMALTSVFVPTVQTPDTVQTSDSTSTPSPNETEQYATDRSMTEQYGTEQYATDQYATDVAATVVSDINNNAATLAASTATSGALTATQTSIANGTLAVNIHAIISASDPRPLNMRSAPGTQSSIIAQLPVNTWVKIIDGPQTVDGRLWWQVKVTTSPDSSLVGKTGWCAESADGKSLMLEYAPPP
jgi:hypothetical protein